jgi:ribosomal protein S16
MRKTLALVAFIAIAVIACKHEIIPVSTQGPGVNASSGSSASQVVCFEGEVLPIFKSNCAKSGCHDVTSKQKGYVFDSYNNIINGVTSGNADNSKIYKMITEKDEDKRMPKTPNPRLTTAQIDVIKRWINEGAKNTTNCNGGCDTAVFTYSQAIRPLLDANCVGCHSGPSAPLGLDYTIYQNIKNVALNGRLIGAVTHKAGFSPMPKNSPQLSDCKITQIKKWIQSGAPNN